MAIVLISRELFENSHGSGVEPTLELFEKMLKLPYPITSWEASHPEHCYRVHVRIPGVDDDQVVMPVYEKTSQDDDYRLVRIEISQLPADPEADPQMTELVWAVLGLLALAAAVLVFAWWWRKP